MNLKVKMRKIQTVLVRKGLVIKINTSQFYSEEQSRMITSYRVSTPVYRRSEKTGEWKTEDYEIIKSCSLADIVFCLMDIHKAVMNL